MIFYFELNFIRTILGITSTNRYDQIRYFLDKGIDKYIYLENFIK